jgi:hypothetical protein
MNVVVDRVKEWVRAAKARAQAVELEQQTRELKLYDMPPYLNTWLNQEIQQLPPHPAYVKTVSETLNGAIQHWLNSENGYNHLVILGSPVERTSNVLTAGLRSWQQQREEAIEEPRVKPSRISWTGRPREYHEIGSKLIAEIDAAKGYSQVYAEVEASRRPRSLIMIPSLSWCFLRCLDGLEAVQLLLDTISQDRTNFWLLGCNYWTWRYLDQVFQISAYFEQTKNLPKLKRAAIRKWLEPVDSKIEFNPHESQIYFKPKQIVYTAESGTNSENSSEDWVSRSQKLYFNSLLNVSTGLSRVAGRAWLRSLKYDIDYGKEVAAIEENASPSTPQANGNGSNSDSSTNSQSNPNHAGNPDNADSSSNGAKEVDITAIGNIIKQEEICGEALSHIRRTRPTLPSLPKLTADDRYLLFSLVMHEDISLPHLAISLGDERGKVRAQVQKLSRAGMLEENHGIFSLNPAYYLALKNDLANNNFLIGEGN